MARDDYRFNQGGWRRFPTLNRTLKKSLKRPRIGVTQGGSSREDAGAKPAATYGQHKKRKAQR